MLCTKFFTTSKNHEISLTAYVSGNNFSMWDPPIINPTEAGRGTSLLINLGHVLLFTHTQPSSRSFNSPFPSTGPYKVISPYDRIITNLLWQYHSFYAGFSIPTSHKQGFPLQWKVETKNPTLYPCGASRSSIWISWTWNRTWVSFRSVTQSWTQIIKQVQILGQLPVFHFGSSRYSRGFIFFSTFSTILNYKYAHFPFLSSNWTEHALWTNSETTTLFATVWKIKMSKPLLYICLRNEQTIVCNLFGNLFGHLELSGSCPLVVDTSSRNTSYFQLCWLMVRNPSLIN